MINISFLQIQVTISKLRNKKFYFDLLIHKMEMQNPDISKLKLNIMQFTIIKKELFKKALKE